ncbi:MAG: OmpA family protein [Hyphomicrobiaceae bacterium]
MKWNVFGWLLGLPILALVWGLAIKGERAPIIIDLESRAKSTLARADIDWAKADFDGTEGRLSGAAYSESERQLALKLMRQTWGVWDIKDETVLIDEAPNYVWGAAVKDDDLHLTGYFPNEKTRRQILQFARKQFPAHAVHDNMQPARGVPGEEIWIDGISFGLRQLMQLKQGGRVDLQGTRLGITGEAESVTAYRTIRGDVLRRLPSGIMLAKDEVVPPRVSPFTWHAKYKANQVEMDGHVPGGKARDKVIEIAKEAFPKAAIVDKMTAADGAPEGWQKAITTALRQMTKLEFAEASMTDQRFSFSGQARKEVTSERVASALKVGMPDTFKLKHKITFREPTLPTVTPFTTTIASDGEKVSLSGYAPDDRGRQRLVASAKQRFPKREIVDALTFANGAPPGWLTCADAGVLGLAALDKGRAELAGPALRLTGETRDEKVATDLPAKVRAAANRACKDTVAIDVKTPPEPNLKWQAVSIENRLELSGEVINSDVKAALLGDAKKLFAKREIVDNMRITPGSSAKWIKVVKLGLAQLAKLRSGLVRLDGLVLTLDGVAPDTAVSTQVKSRIGRGIPVGYTGQAIIEVKSDAMIWSEQEAKRKSAAAAAEALRKKAEEEKRAASLREVQRRAAEAAAKARAEAEERQRRKAAALRKAAEKAAAEARARATEEERRRAAKAEAKAREAAAACKKRLNETVGRGDIQFEVGSNRLTESSTGTLDRLIENYRKCPGLQLEIAGHTDSTGNASDNLDLSKRRAEAVRDYFISKGLPGDKFVARGYGETRPRVSNNSAANRARNRRIEFDVMTN